MAVSLKTLLISDTVWQGEKDGVEDGLRAWCAEVSKNSSEYSDRLRAAKKIRDCYNHHNHELDLREQLSNISSH